MMASCRSVPDPIPLEDDCQDILAKAQRGLGWADSQIAAKAGLEPALWRQARGGKHSDEVLRAAAPVLNLDPDRLIALAHRAWHPEVPAPPGLTQFNMPYPYPLGKSRVNAYALRIPGGNDCLLFDAGPTAVPILEHLKSTGGRAVFLGLTHGHSDHVGGVIGLVRPFPGMALWAHPKEWQGPGAAPAGAGSTATFGPLRIEVRETPGHSPGGLSFVVWGNGVPLAFTGDALFAGSMGGAGGHWEEARQAVRREILSLPGHTIVCPGHGPLTTVEMELAHNPLFSSP